MLEKLKGLSELFEKYLVVWKAFGDIRDADQKGLGIFFDERYDIKLCVRFSVECIAIGAIVFVCLRWLASLIGDDGAIKILQALDPAFSMGPLVAEFYALGYVVVAIFSGTALHYYLGFIAAAGERQPLALTRLFVMYPGIAVNAICVSLAVLMACNWLAGLLDAALPRAADGSATWLYWVLAVPIGFAGIFAASALLGAFLMWPILIVRVVYRNYNFRGILALAAIPVAICIYGL